MTVSATTQAFARPRLDIGLAFKGGWKAFTADVVALLVGALIAGVLSVITLGILAGPLTAGLYSMVVGRLRDGRHAQIGDVFSQFDRFWAYLWAAIVLFVLIALASLTIVGGVLLATVWIYVFPNMVDRRMRLTEAMGASYHQVVDNGFWEHLALIVIFFAISAVANGWVGIVTTPFTIAVIAAAYFVADGRGGLIEHPPAPPAAPAPQAPVATAPYATAVITAPPAQAPVAQAQPAPVTAAPVETTEVAPEANAPASTPETAPEAPITTDAPAATEAQTPTVAPAQLPPTPPTPPAPPAPEA